MDMCIVLNNLVKVKQSEFYPSICYLLRQLCYNFQILYKILEKTKNTGTE